MATTRLLTSFPLARSSYYYQPRLGQRGRAISPHTVTQSGLVVANEKVVEWIRELLRHPFICYGYKKVTDWLRQNKGLIINKKKVYRLMKQAHLLLPKKPANQSARCFVEVRKMVAERPNEAFQFDIKMYWVTGLGWVPCLSVIDIFTRQLKAHLLQRSIRQHDVKALWEDLLKGIPAEQHALIRVRSDNGSQFAAKTVRAFFTTEGIYQEFCHAATPEEDGYIESFHSIVERELVKRHEWQSQSELSALMASYVYFYNTERLHGSLRNVSPDKFASQWADVQKQAETGYLREETIANELAIPVQFIGG